MGSPVIWGGNKTSKNLQKNINFADKVTKLHDSFDAANNQSTAADVTGLNLNGFRAASIELSVDIQATADKFSKVRLDAIQKNGAWQLSEEVLGDETNITFTITSGGQIQYTSANEAGFVSSKFAFTASLMEI